MKKKLSILLLILLAASLVLKAQVKNTGFLLTDRDVYVSGENLLAKVFVPQDQDFKVVYLSLSAIDGQLITSAKLKIENHEAAGYLYLPDSLHTGSFLLNAFSSHFVKQDFYSKEIVVINRFTNPDQGVQLERANLPEVPMVNQLLIDVQNLKESYQKRQDVSLSFQLNSELKKEITGKLSIVVSEVVPGWQARYLPVHPNFDHSILLTKYRGVVMEGMVTNTETKVPVDGATVYLTKPDSVPYFDYYRTSADGRFYFLLKDCQGVQPLIVQAVKEGENDQLKVQLDDQFSHDALQAEAKPVNLTKAEQSYFSKAVSIVTFDKVYQQNELEVAKSAFNKPYPFPFYGAPDVQVDPDEFFDMRNFNELSKELLSPVRFRERKDGYTLNLVDRDHSKYFVDLPLMTIDGVPVQKVSQIADMGTKEIDWIDVVPHECFYGDQ
ncbi:MAG TPA: hypothetical protein VKA27_03935, partial [Sunxiuqinia sp.]|nr:hypothetical protein [Sunxiuqinia sp.]